MENIDYLKIPLYKLYYLKNVNDFRGFDSNDLEALRKEYSNEEITGILNSLAWASKNPSYDFSSMLPNLGHNNEDIYIYICKAYQSLNIEGNGKQ